MQQKDELTHFQGDKGHGATSDDERPDFHHLDDHGFRQNSGCHCNKPLGPKPEIQHDQRGRGVPTLT